MPFSPLASTVGGVAVDGIVDDESWFRREVHFISKLYFVIYGHEIAVQ